jgi:hypothetical protein
MEGNIYKFERRTTVEKSRHRWDDNANKINVMA